MVTAMMFTNHHFQALFNAASYLHGSSLMQRGECILYCIYDILKPRHPHDLNIPAALGDSSYVLESQPLPNNPRRDRVTAEHARHLRPLTN